MDQTSAQTTPKSHPPLIFILLVLVLIAIFIFGLKWIFGLGQGEVGSVPFLVFDYAVGLTMIFLPCTLPLAFVIVPMVMGKSYQKGIGMVLAFGLGVTITLSIYGALIGLLGQVLGVNQVETAKNILYALAGLMAILFALGELGLIKFKSPTYSGGVPQFIMKQKDIAKAGLLGLFMGNVGVGCPNPLFNAVIIPQIVATGSPFQGFIIMVVQALGRITPLFILAFLAILGINATSFLVAHKDKVTKITAWATLYVGGFLLTLGLFGHDWWVLSGIHTLGEKITQEDAITTLLGSKIEQFGHTHAMPVGGASWFFNLPVTLGTTVLVASWVLPMFWYLLKRERNVSQLPAELQAAEKKYLGLLTWFFVLISAFIITVFGYLLPHNFTAHWSKEAMMHEEDEIDQHDDDKMNMTNVSDFHATLSSSPSAVLAGKPFVLHIALHDSKGNPISDLKVSHERILHVILVSEDLEEFIHVHPEDTEQPIIVDAGSNEFVIPLTLSKAGRYRVLIDANRFGNEVSATYWLSVGGKTSNILIEKNVSQDKTFDGYDVILSVEPKTPKTGEEVHLNYQIERDGKQILDTDKYLGADMHLLITPLDLSVMSHTHGLKVTSSQGNKLGEIDAHYAFPFPGVWKIYGQFQHLEKVVTTEFMVEVGQGTQSAQMMAPHVDEH